MNKYSLVLLGELLHLANSNPPFAWKYEFYGLKDLILKQHGELVGCDLQHIREECYACNGSGKQQLGGLTVFGEAWQSVTGRSCLRCGGSGAYKEFWVNLLRYRIGRREFHLPLQRYFQREDAGVGYLEEIEGYIRHENIKYYLSSEAVYWLSLWFDTKLFFKHFGRSGFPSRKFTPMVIVATWVFYIRIFPGEVGHRWHRLLWRIQAVRQKFCAHDFGYERVEYECKKCHLTNPDFEVPF